MSELVTRRDGDGIATLALNRPETLNALSPQLFEELRAHLDAIAEQLESVGCVILKGEGRSFSSGNDLTAILARSIVANSWHTLRADKRLVNEGQRYTLAEGLAFERSNSTGITPDTLARLQEFGSKEKG